jgi:hypothetical protein
MDKFLGQLHMDKQLSQLIDEAITLEHNISNIYEIFSKMLPEDSDFWSELVCEEKNHATLLETAKKTLLTVDLFPSKLLLPTLGMLIDTNNKLHLLIDEYKESPPSREVAFYKAIDIELYAGEIHFQHAMKHLPSDEIMDTIQQLNKDDKDHIVRIRTYMHEKSISSYTDNL